MDIYTRSEANRKAQIYKPSNLNLKERGKAELETGGRQLRVASVTRNSGVEKGTAGRLSSQNPKLRRSKERENSGGQKEKRKRQQAVKVEAERWKSPFHDGGFQKSRSLDWNAPNQ